MLKLNRTSRHPEGLLAESNRQLGWSSVGIHLIRRAGWKRQGLCETYGSADSDLDEFHFYQGPNL
jgi:hypothetical protein